MCPLIKELKKRESVDVRVLSTGQHKEMLDEVLKFENIKPDYDFSLMKIGQTLSYLTVSILSQTEKILDELLPDFVLVHGDTVTAFAGALASFYKKIPICHVEAGLRTFDKYNPYPEEFNRGAIARMATYHFAPTEANKESLLREGIDEKNIFVVGNTVIDALKKNVMQNYSHENLPSENFIILTAHRRENIGEGMERIFSAVKRVCETKKIKAVYPIHKNEAILPIAEKVFKNSDSVKIIPPLEVFDFHNFLAKCKLIITDSGGVQEEAGYLGKPVLITRKTTERKELFTNSSAKLVGNDENEIFEEAKRLIENDEYYKLSAVPTRAFGDGNTASRIADIFLECKL